LFIEMNAWIAPKLGGNQLGDWFAGDQANRLASVPPEHGPKRQGDPFEGMLDILALGRLNGKWIVEPLTENLEMSPSDLLDLEALPEPLIKVAKFVDTSRPKPNCAADDFGRPEGALAWSAVERDEFNLGNPLRKTGDFGAAAIAQGEVKDALDPVLLVVDGRARPDKDHLGHSCDGSPADSVGALPR
jgi:hypothetical protein